MKKAYTIGVDFGTDSVRALLVDTTNGANVATAVSKYSRWAKQLYCDSSLSLFRQHPLDYIESIHEVLTNVLKDVSDDIRSTVVGISIDTTGSTPVAVDQQGTPLALLPEFESNPNAMFILWKDHTANDEADEINALARQWTTDYTKYVGGIYSSEWFWAKVLHILREDESVRAKAFSWVEHCDWMSAFLTGNTDPLTMKRSRCAAGHKAMWHEEFDGLPSEDFLQKLDPLLTGLRSRLYNETFTSDESMGTLSKEWASKLGLSTDVVIGVGGFDCHMGAIGARIKPYDFVRVMGTSTCDMLIAPKDEVGNILVKGICGQVDGSITKGMIGFEAGQSAYGDYYAWWQKVIAEPVRGILGDEAADNMMDKLIPYLSEKAISLPLTGEDAIATDWINGRRTPDANHKVKATLTGLSLGTDAVHIFKMLVEATAYGSKAIVDRIVSEGIKIQQVIAIGGVAKKSPFVMQTLCNVLNMPIKVASSDQACALGAAINAAVAANIYTTTDEAQEVMGSDYDEVYTPEPDKVLIYKKLYSNYLSLGKFTEKND